MESILVLTHCDETGEQLSKGSLEAVTAGRELSTQLGATLTIGIVCGSLENLAKSISSAGARLLVVSGEAFTQPRYASDAAACEAICRTAQPTIVLAPHSSRFARVMAAVAHRVHGCIDTHITAIIGAEEIHATRWFYRQRMEAVVTRELRQGESFPNAVRIHRWRCRPESHLAPAREFPEQSCAMQEPRRQSAPLVPGLSRRHTPRASRSRAAGTMDAIHVSRRLPCVGDRTSVLRESPLPR